MRAIDADKVPELFDKEYRETMKLIREGENHLNSLAEGFSEEAKVIREMPTIEPYGTWIPCSERLPKVEGSYMTTTEYGAVRVNHFYTRNNTWGYKSNRTIAWMPLPEPYREEKKDE